MTDFLSWVVGGLALGLLVYEFVFKQGDLFDNPTDCSEEDVPIVDPDDTFDQ